MRLTDKYRPRKFADVIGQSKAVSILQRIKEPGGRSIYITGKSGTGKTTLAEIIAATMPHDSDGFPVDIARVVGRELTTGKLRDITDRWIYCGSHVLIVNESHGLSRPVIECFLDLLESLRPNVCVIFTTTNEGNDLFEEHIDAAPFASRCLVVKLTSQGLAQPFAAYAQTVAQIENLDGRPIDDYVRLVNDCKGNLRAVLNRIEAGEMLA